MGALRRRLPRLGRRLHPLGARGSRCRSERLLCRAGTRIRAATGHRPGSLEGGGDMSLSEPLSGLFAKPYEEIRALEARSRMDAGAILVDVREPAEWAAGHAAGARHIPPVSYTHL